MFTCKFALVMYLLTPLHFSLLSFNRSRFLLLLLLWVSSIACECAALPTASRTDWRWRKNCSVSHSSGIWRMSILTCKCRSHLNSVNLSKDSPTAWTPWAIWWMAQLVSNRHITTNTNEWVCREIHPKLGPRRNSVALTHMFVSIFSAALFSLVNEGLVSNILAHCS